MGFPVAQQQVFCWARFSSIMHRICRLPAAPRDVADGLCAKMAANQRAEAATVRNQGDAAWLAAGSGRRRRREEWLGGGSSGAESSKSMPMLFFVIQKQPLLSTSDSIHICLFAKISNKHTLIIHRGQLTASPRCHLHSSVLQTPILPNAHRIYRLHIPVRACSTMQALRADARVKFRLARFPSEVGILACVNARSGVGRSLENRKLELLNLAPSCYKCSPQLQMPSTSAASSVAAWEIRNEWRS